MDRYAFASVQFTRGCPFLCEFCDIIVIFGRKPRIKTVPQIISELEALRAQKLDLVFIVDDNFIGNKKAIKEVLRSIIEWQRANGFPFQFLTEATLDLADDDELMRLMAEANICAVFIGIESTNVESLRETRKLQNARPGSSMVERVRRIQDAGMEVWAGMILGFDHDDQTVFEAQRAFLDTARISLAMVGMLSAIPKTPLHARLASAGRLDQADVSMFGTNVLPLQMSRSTLSDGYVRLMTALYEPQAYFDRVDDLLIAGRIECARGWLHYAAQHPWRRRFRHLRYWLEAFGLLVHLMWQIPEAALRRCYRKHCWAFLRARRNPIVARVYVIKCAFHYHMYRMALRLTAQASIINTF
jgi:radical SAM superfamily enzyme YgiQ (UPF0313 family)